MIQFFKKELLMNFNNYKIIIKLKFQINMIQMNNNNIINKWLQNNEYKIIYICI